jgi:hypothetical protein
MCRNVQRSGKRSAMCSNAKKLGKAAGLIAAAIRYSVYWPGK